MDDAQRNFERLVRTEFAEWPEGAKLDVREDPSKGKDVERDFYLCDLLDKSGTVIGMWEGVGRQRMYDPVTSFSMHRIA